MLDRLGIHYALRTYEATDAHLSAAEVAAAVGLPPERVFKTLVVRGDRTGPLFVGVPAPAEIDLKAAARASGNRAVQRVPLKEVTALTGYVRGGTTALAAKKALAVVDGGRKLGHLVEEQGGPGQPPRHRPIFHILEFGIDHGDALCSRFWNLESC